MGLTNIVLRCHDIMQIGSEFGSFDYIIAHGVYSWVPDAVREKMLSIFRENLSPHGIAFVSYNCYPGCHSRDIARQIMRYHVRDVDRSACSARCRAARVLRFLAEASAEDTIYGFELRNQLDRINGIDDRVLFHDDLSDVASPFYLHQVVEAAPRHGLQYLSDAAFAISHLGRLSPAGAREAFGNSRRRCRDPRAIHGFRRRDAPFARACSVTARSRCSGASIRAGSPNITSRRPRAPPTARSIRRRAGIVTFKTESGSTLSTDHRLSKAVIQILGARWPETMQFCGCAGAGAVAARRRGRADPRQPG